MGERKKGLPPQPVKMPNPQLVMFLTSCQGGVAQNPANQREMCVALGLSSGPLEVNALMPIPFVAGVIDVLTQAREQAQIAQTGIVPGVMNGDGVDLSKLSEEMSKLRGEGQ